ncbi:MAG: LacI family DNA-binding transcriptional regulator [Rhodobacteraceae bacterium]|nr:LacI family DNA-binding transcriptional regulator [Paracoccaceae bacterium]MCY4250821.1 LacI family DNA-binding transcriptional regulator [Paracoccaceae bacterium]MCY4306839.1 LacI family DNA-binding transcriptional regulator [Paracoccaceae bacterium]
MVIKKKRNVVTLKDIAKEVGVDKSTVSRALNSGTQDLLTPEVVAKIQDAATRMGYRKNQLARSLRTHRTMIVGIVLPDITNTLFAPIVRGAESVLEPLGYTSMIVNTDDDSERRNYLIGVLLERGVDGIIDAAPQISASPFKTIEEHGIPLVTAIRKTDHTSIPAVINDDEEGIRLLIQYLYARGHRKIAHIAGPLALSTGNLRLNAFKHHMIHIGLDIPEKAIAYANRFDEDEGSRCALDLLVSGLDCSAVICANDRLALGAIKALHQSGVTCPEHISVTGFNDLPFLNLIPPGLTTIRIQQFDVGRLSAELLTRMMTTQDATIPRTSILPVELVERGSVSKPWTNSF